MGISRLRVSLSIRPCARGCKSCFFAEPTRAHLLGGDASGRELQRLASAAASAPCAPPFATKRKRSGGQAGCARLVHQFCSSSWQAAALATLGGITQPQLSNLQSSVRQLTVCSHTNPHKPTQTHTAHAYYKVGRRRPPGWASEGHRAPDELQMEWGRLERVIFIKQNTTPSRKVFANFGAAAFALLHAWAATCIQRSSLPNMRVGIDAVP